MTDPASALRTAIYVALTSPALVSGAGAVPVPVYGPVAPADSPTPYVVLSSQTATGEQLAAGCVQQEVTLLVDVVTAFPGQHITTAVADAIAAQIVPRLTAAGFAVGTYAVVARGLPLSELMTQQTPTETTVRRLLRVRYRLLESSPTV